MDSLKPYLDALKLKLDVLRRHAGAKEGYTILLEVVAVCEQIPALGVQVVELAVTPRRNPLKLALRAGLDVPELLVSERDAIHELLDSSIDIFLI